MKRHAFTLVELLVVIGIIALLISILLPSLTSARRQALKVACLSTHRQMATATAIYAAENRNWIAPRFRYATNAELKAGTGFTYFSPIAATYYGDEETKGEPYGGNTYALGLLVNGGYMPTGTIDLTTAETKAETMPEFFLCPSSPGRETFVNEGRVNYMYNPHVVYVSEANPVYQSRYQKTTDFPDDKCLTIDVLESYGDINHADGENKETWNLSFIDGSANSATSAAVGDIILGRNVAGKWDRLNDYRDVLEKVATGGEVLIEGGAFGGYNWGGNRRDPYVYLEQ